MAEHGGDLSSFLVAFASALLAAKLLGELCHRIGQPPVLGELLAGVLLGPSVIGLVPLSAGILLIAEIGILLLLFEVGFETFFAPPLLASLARTIPSARRSPNVSARDNKVERA